MVTSILSLSHSYGISIYWYEEVELFAYSTFFLIWSYTMVLDATMKKERVLRHAYLMWSVNQILSIFLLPLKILILGSNFNRFVYFMDWYTQILVFHYTWTLFVCFKFDCFTLHLMINSDLGYEMFLIYVFFFLLLYATFLLINSS